jgi:ABC-type oligopeptide transport system substrate-binding subunit
MNTHWQVKRLLRLATVGLVLITAALSLSACAKTAEEEGGEEAATVEPIKGTDVNRVTLTKEAAETLGIETVAIKQVGGREVVPDAAVVYAADGHTYTYSSPKPFTYVRADITVARIDGRKAILKKGPPAGTNVVTVGSPELFGLENEYEPE